MTCIRCAQTTAEMALQYALAQQYRMALLREKAKNNILEQRIIKLNKKVTK